MANNHKRDQWLRDIEARQRNVVFPDTVQNETRFWHNISKRPLNTSSKIGLAFLALLGWGIFTRLFFATIQAGVTWLFVLGMLLVWGPIFGVIAWATRHSLRNIHNARRGR
jgi:succinate-acetate transporter protein